MYVLLGNQYVRKIYRRYEFIRINDIVYRKKYLKRKNGDRREMVIYIPISKRVVSTFQNPIFLIILILLAFYAVYELINFFAVFYPIKYAYNGGRMLLYCTSKDLVRDIWRYFPQYSLELLYNKINILGESCPFVGCFDDNLLYMINNTLKFCSILCILNLGRKKIKMETYLKTVCLFFICLLNCMFVLCSILPQCKRVRAKSVLCMDRVEFRKFHGASR